MYKDYNDYELIYLMNEGDYRAELSLFEKYEYVSAKMYARKRMNGKMLYSDFKQECLMCLSEAIKSFNPDKNMPFFVYYNILINRRVNRILAKRFFFNEIDHISLSDLEIADDKGSDYSIKKTIEDLDEEENLKALFVQHYAYGVKISELSRKNSIKYQELYNKFKKIRDKLEKRLTK